MLYMYNIEDGAISTTMSRKRGGAVPPCCVDSGVPILFLRSKVGLLKMAKQSISRGGTSRIRFIMLDAEIPDGDLSQITSAIQNALKPTTIVHQRINGQATPAALIANGADPAEASDEQVLDLEDEAVGQELPKTPRSSKPRKPTTPDVLDLDLVSDPPLADFAKVHPSNNEIERNLVVAAWFNEQRDTPTVTVAHIYTAYRSLGWSVGFEDFAWPLRSLKKDKYMSSPNRGEYTINHLGLDRVRKMGAGAD